MERILKVITAVLLVGGGMVGIALILIAEGLDRAEKWVSICGTMTSVVLTAAGLVLGWHTWRRPRADGPSSGRPAVETSVPPVDPVHLSEATAGKYIVDARWAKGVVNGDNATQHNTF